MAFRLRALVGLFPVLLFSVSATGCQQFNLLQLYFQEKQYTEDQTLVAKVKGALLAEPSLRGANIAVDAYLKDVELTGKVSSPRQASRATEIAQSVSGVKSVTNALTIQSARAD